MKKITRLLLTALASATVFFAGCSMLDDASVSESGSSFTPQTETPKMTVLTGQIPNLMDYDSTLTRSILPAADNKNYDYYIMGRTITGVDYKDPADTTKKYKQLSYGDAGSGKDIMPNGSGVPEFTLPIATAAWELTLCAVPKGTPDITDTNMKDKAALVAYAYADLTKNTDAVLFVLSPDGLSGAGNVALTLYLSNNSQIGTKDSHPGLWELPDGYTCEVYIQNLITGNVVTWLDSGNPPAQETTVTFEDPNPGTPFGINSKSSVVIGSGHTINPGTYNFVVMFKHAGLPTSVWSDVLIVLPTKSTTQNVFVPNVLGKEPANVTTFNGYYVGDSLDLPERPGYYLAHFEWDAPNVTTERYFEIQIGEIASNSVYADLIVDDDKWVDADVQNYRDYAAEAGDACVELRKQEEYYDGSLLANNTRCSVFVPLGKALVARIRAVNNIGTSKNWTYLALPKAYSKLPATGNDSKGGQTDSQVYSTSLNATLTGKIAMPFDTNAPAQIMNHFRITYDLNGGSYGATGVTTNRVVYGTQAQLAKAGRKLVKLWAANGNDAALKKTPSAFNCWSTEAVANESSRVYRAVSALTPATPALGDWACMLSTDGTGGAMTFTQTDVAGVNAMKTVAVGVTPTVASIEAADKGGYIGIENLYLYADYSTSFDAGVTKEDATADFFLATDWIKIKSDSTAPDSQYNTPVVVGNKSSATPTADSKVETSAVKKISKKLEIKAGVNKLQFSIDMPEFTGTPPRAKYYINNKEFKLDELWMTAEVTISILDAQKSNHCPSETKTLTNGDATFSYFDFTTWENGRYTAYIDMTATKNGRPITRSARVTLDIVD